MKSSVASVPMFSRSKRANSSGDSAIFNNVLTAINFFSFTLERVPDHDEGLVSAVRVVRIGDHVAGADEEVLLREHHAGAGVAVSASARSVINSGAEHPTVVHRLEVVLDAADCSGAVAKCVGVYGLE